MQRKRFLPKVKSEPVSNKVEFEKMSKEQIAKENIKKIEQNKEFTKKLAIERADRKQKILERENDRRKKILKEIEDYSKEKNQQNLKISENKQKKIEKAKVEKLKKSFFQVQSQEKIPSLVHKKPLFIKMEEIYQKNVLMPELEQKNSDLAKKRLLYQPLNHEELMEHFSKHENNLRFEEYRRKKELEKKKLDSELNSIVSIFSSKFTHALVEEEKKKKEEIEKKKNEKKINANKRIQYSKLVKEIFSPIINKQKNIQTTSKKSLYAAISVDKL